LLSSRVNVFSYENFLVEILFFAIVHFSAFAVAWRPIVFSLAT